MPRGFEPATTSDSSSIVHPGEDDSNAVREQLAQVAPRGLRTFTPSLAVIAKSSGCYHWTPEGRRLADFTSGVLVANLGHNSARWWQRVWDYLGLSPAADVSRPESFLTAAPLTAYNAITELELRATQRLLDSLQAEPGGGRCEQVLWAASGSEAIQKALWAALARRPDQDVILATRRGFHGKKGLAGAVTGTEHDRDRDTRVRFISFPMEECRDVTARRRPLDLAPYERELAAVWDEFGPRICCVITEPYLGGGGSFHPQKEYLGLLERFCREHDLVFILDEIQSNFGRTGEMYAFTTYGVEPDIVCLGKGLANGIPVAAAAGRSELLGGLAYGEASDTWSGNPLSSAGVLATLDEFEDGSVLEQARRLSGVLENGLLALEALPAVAHVRGEGVVWGVECRATPGRTAAETACEIVKTCYLGDAASRAIHLLGPLAGNVLRIAPPLVMPPDEAEEYLRAMYEIVQRLS